MSLTNQDPFPAGTTADTTGPPTPAEKISNVAGLLRISAQRDPNGAGVIFHGRTSSFAEIDEMADAAAAALAGLGLTVWEVYGLTEAGPAVATSAMGTSPKEGSVGLPLPGVEVRLVDEHGEDALDGDPGEIYVRGPNVLPGYWGRPEESAAAFEDLWLRTGDVAVRDEDGHIHLVDRKHDVITVSGFNVFPREVEEAIMEHPGVARAAVAGLPHESMGEAVVAWVVPGSGVELTPEQLLALMDTWPGSSGPLRFGSSTSYPAASPAGCFGVC